MATQAPTTNQIKETIITQIEASISQSIPLLPKAFIRVLASVLAATFVTLYKYSGFIFLQIFVRTASGSSTTVLGRTVTPLVEWGRLIGLGDPLEATAAQLTIDVTVENQTGVLSSGAQLLGATNGVTYLTIADVLLDAATVQVTVKAVADQNGTGGVGTLGNLDAGATVNFANPLPNVARAATVVTQTVTGADAETTEAYRQRVIDRFQRRPQGGSYADYDFWGSGVEGIGNIYPYTGATPGQVDVYVESATETDGIPTQAQLDAVDEAIQFEDNGLASRRPANAWVNVAPITRTSFDVTVNGLTADNLAQVQTDVTEAVEQYFLEAAPFIPGLDVLPRKDSITSVELQAVVNDIVQAAGGSFTSALFTLTGSPSAISAYVLGEGEKAKATVGYA